MPTVFTTGTINQPDAGSVGLAMVEKIRDDVSAHAAWDLVEEFTAASGTCRWYVLKCLAAQSGLPSDFYVVMGRILSTGEIRIFPCEAYNPAGHASTFWPLGSYSVQQGPYDSSGRFATDFVLGTTITGGGTGQPSYARWLPAGTSTKWWIIVTDDAFTVAFNGPSNGFFDVGTYISLAQSTITMPIALFGSSLSGTGAGMICRNPALAGVTLYYAAGFIVANPGTQQYDLLGFDSDMRYNDRLQNNQRPVAEVKMEVYNYNTGDSAICGRALGKRKRMRATAQSVPVAVAFGDAYVFQNRLWVPYLPTDGRFWDTGVPSS